MLSGEIALKNNHYYYYDYAMTMVIIGVFVADALFVFFDEKAMCSLEKLQLYHFFHYYYSSSNYNSGKIKESASGY